MRSSASTTYSAHLIRDKGLHDAIAQFQRQERSATAHEMALLAEHSPLRQTGKPSCDWPD